MSGFPFRPPMRSYLGPPDDDPQPVFGSPRWVRDRDEVLADDRVKAEQEREDGDGEG